MLLVHELVTLVTQITSKIFLLKLIQLFESDLLLFQDLIEVVIEINAVGVRRRYVKVRLLVRIDSALLIF